MVEGSCLRGGCRPAFLVLLLLLLPPRGASAAAAAAARQSGFSRVDDGEALVQHVPYFPGSHWPQRGRQPSWQNSVMQWGRGNATSDRDGPALAGVPHAQPVERVPHAQPVEEVTGTAADIPSGARSDKDGGQKDHVRAGTAVSAPALPRDRNQELATKAAVRDDILQFLRRLSFVPPLVRGQVVSWLVPQIMTIWRSSTPQVRSLIDFVASIDMSDLNPQNRASKVDQLFNAFNRSGYRRIGSLRVATLDRMRHYVDEYRSQGFSLNTSSRLLTELAGMPIAAPDPASGSFLRTLGLILGQAANRESASVDDIVQELHITNASEEAVIVADAILMTLDSMSATGSGHIFHHISSLWRVFMKWADVDGNSSSVSNYTITDYVGDMMDEFGAGSSKGNVTVEHLIVEAGKLSSRLLAYTPEDVQKFMGSVQINTRFMSELALLYVCSFEGARQQNPDCAYHTEEGVHALMSSALFLNSTSMIVPPESVIGAALRATMLAQHT